MSNPSSANSSRYIRRLSSINDILTQRSKAKSPTPSIDRVYYFQVQQPHVDTTAFDGVTGIVKQDNILIFEDNDDNALVQTVYDHEFHPEDSVYFRRLPKGEVMQRSSQRYKSGVCESHDVLFRTILPFSSTHESYIKLNWHNAMFFSENAIALTPSSKSFICRYDKFRRQFINHMIYQSKMEGVDVEQVGSVSCVSDVDISLSPSASSSMTIEAKANAIIKTLYAMYEVHHSKFEDSFEEMFDTNVYATSFTMRASANARLQTMKQFVHPSKPGNQVMYFVNVSDPMSCKFDKLQTLFAFRRVFCNFLDIGGIHTIESNLKAIYTHLKWNNSSRMTELFKDIINDVRSLAWMPQNFTETNMKEFYMRLNSNVNDEGLLSIYTCLIKSYYWLIEDGSHYHAKHMLPHILSSATLLEQDSYHSMGAFLDVVTFAGMSIRDKCKHMPIPCMFDHSLLDNLGFVIDIIKRHERDPCYDTTTNVLKISKYIDRMCNAIKSKQNSSSIPSIDSVHDTCRLANEARKELKTTSEEKRAHTANVLNVIMGSNKTIDTTVGYDELLTCIIKMFDPFLTDCASRLIAT